MEVSLQYYNVHARTEHWSVKKDRTLNYDTNSGSNIELEKRSMVEMNRRRVLETYNW